MYRPFPGAGTPKAPDFRALAAQFLPNAIVVFGILAVGLIWFGAFANMARERAVNERAALQNAGNLARAFEEQIAQSLRSADQALLDFRDSYERDGGRLDLVRWARPYRALTDFVRQIAVIDRNGMMAASNIETSELVDLNDREHFRVHRDRNMDVLFISKPVKGRVSGLQTIQLTRRISAPDGSFNGVMVLSIDPAYFVGFFETIDLGPEGSISLMGTDGILRAHGAHERRSIGASIAGGRLMSEFGQAPSGSYRAISRSDGIDRFVTYRAVKGYPLIVSVDLGADDVFADYYFTRRVRLTAGALLTALLAPLIMLIVRYQRNLAQARDAAEAGTRARAKFLAMMSHEIRTPLNAVLGFASGLLESRLDAEQRRTATALHSAGDSLLRLLNDILDFSRLDSGRIEFEAIPFSPAAVVETAVSVMGPAAADKGLVLKVDIDPNLPPAMLGDAGRLRQVLLNLAANAIKFTTSGEVSIAARCLGCADGQAIVHWTVTDTGPGIAPDRIGDIFGDFVQANNSVNRKFGGSGLGLAICKRIADQMGGQIGVVSELGRGSEFSFTVTLPTSALALEPENEGSPIQALEAEVARIGRPLRILIAEDNPTNQLVSKQMLRDVDGAITVASNGVEACELAGRFGYDVILMDMQMPEMNGIQATRAIRAGGGENAETPILALTANAYAEDVRACLEAGMNSFVAKPVRKAVLLDAILRAVQRLPAAPAGAAGTGAASQTAPASAPVLLDPPMVDELIDEIGIEAAGEVLEKYLVESRNRLVTLQGLSAAQHEEILLEAHALKGSSGIFGLPRLSALARDLEHASVGMTAEQYCAALAALNQALAESETALRDYFATHARPAAA